MAPGSKANKKSTVDAAAWMFNVVTSVGIIIVNKALMATYGFSFGNNISILFWSHLSSFLCVCISYFFDFTAATTLTGLHFATTTLMTLVLRCLGYIQPSHLPFTELLKFILFANFSIVGMNVSLMWNSVGFYQVKILAKTCLILCRCLNPLFLICQIAKLSMIPVACLLEVVFDKIRYSRDTKLSIGLVLVGVGVCTVTDVSVNTKGFVAAFVAVWSTALQQYVSSQCFTM